MAELTKQEQENVRAVLRVLKVRHGGLAPVAVRLETTCKSLEKIYCSTGIIGARIAIRAAQFAGVPIDDVLSGRFPGRTHCRNCGHPIDDATNNEETPDVH